MTSADPVASAQLPVAARAPGKCIVFGEHAVVHGRPELLLAIDLWTQVLARPAARTELNGEPDAVAENPYVRTALAELWPPGGPSASWRTVSTIPRSAGLGSSAALTAAMATAILATRGGAERSEVAESAFKIERAAQGVGSPGDTSASVAGGLVTVNAPGGTLLWELAHEAQRWTVRRVADPGWVWVVAYSGVPRSTGDAVRAVGRRLAADDGPDLLDAFERVALEGIDAVRSEDRELAGRRMDENQELLRRVGVSHERLEELLATVRPVAAGAKLTGAGAGGSIVVLPQAGHEVEALQRLKRAGAQPYVVRSARSGADLVTPGARAGPVTS